MQLARCKTAQKSNGNLIENIWLA